jgi:glycosyltransferase involved in cell wall biosynthesis
MEELYLLVLDNDMYFLNKLFFKRRNRNRWVFDKSSLNPAKRKRGISGFMRLRNEADFLKLAIESHIPFLEELIIVHNRCTDNTPQIAHECQQKYPNKIKVYHYEPFVFPQGSKEHKYLPADSENSLVNYYNFALSKTTMSHAVKIDGDHVAIPELFEAAVNQLYKKGDKLFYCFQGINLWDDQGVICVNGNRPFTGGYDIGFFKVQRNTFFKHHPTWETFSHRLNNYKLGPIFFHLKSMKKDRGLANYDLLDNPLSEYHRYIEIYYNNPPLIKWSDFLLNNRYLSNIPHPESLGIKPIRNNAE